MIKAFFFVFNPIFRFLKPVLVFSNMILHLGQIVHPNSGQKRVSFAVRLDAIRRYFIVL